MAKHLNKVIDIKNNTLAILHIEDMFVHLQCVFHGIRLLRLRRIGCRETTNFFCPFTFLFFCPSRVHFFLFPYRVIFCPSLFKNFSIPFPFIFSIPFPFLTSRHAAHHAEAAGDSCEHGNDEIDDGFQCFFFHGFKILIITVNAFLLMLLF